MLISLFGLLGALIASRQIPLMLVIVMFLSGFLVPNVDNWGHLGGFLGGYLISRIGGLDPRYQEGIWHLFLASMCPGLTAMSIIASIVNFV